MTTAPFDSRTVRTVGRYALYDEIAAGGMATVHLGRLLGPVGFSRTVAIKRLHPQYAKDPHFVAMFLDEARLAARIRHPNVVSTLDVVATEGELFLVMEYIHGESLSGLIKCARHRAERIPPPMAACIMTGMLNGLHAAHQARSERGELLGIVHRDVSPQNVLVGVDGVPRVLDFGVAKAVGRLQSTNDGQLKGKFSYMAPEQIEGGEGGPPTDVFAAGLVMWETLVGRRPIQAGTEVERMYQIIRGELPRMRSVVPSLPEELDRIVMKALSKDASDRYPTALAMALDIENLDLVVAQRRIGAWAEELAGDRLEKRARRAEEIETVSHASVPRFDGANGPISGADVMNHVSRASDEEAARQSFVDLPNGPPSRSELSTPTGVGGEPSSPSQRETSTFGAASAPFPADPPAGPRRPAALVVGAVLATVALLGAVAVGRRSAAPAPAAAVLAVPMVASAAPSGPPLPVASVAPAPAEGGAALPVASAVPLVEPDATKADSGTPKKGGKARGDAASRPPVRNKASCSTPFTIDANGIRRLKPECN